MTLEVWIFSFLLFIFFFQMIAVADLPARLDRWCHLHYASACFNRSSYLHAKEKNIWEGFVSKGLWFRFCIRTRYSQVSILTSSSYCSMFFFHASSWSSKSLKFFHFRFETDSLFSLTLLIRPQSTAWKTVRVEVKPVIYVARKPVAEWARGAEWVLLWIFFWTKRSLCWSAFPVQTTTRVRRRWLGVHGASPFTFWSTAVFYKSLF